MNTTPSETHSTVLAYLGLGSNLGDRARTIRGSLEAIDALEETRVTRTSSLWQTEPKYVLDQPRFLNACAEIETSLSARRLLEHLMTIESRFGRVRHVDKGPRALDLDILLWGDETIAAEGLTIPHPAMHERAFVLAPLAEIAPEAVHPSLGRSVAQLFERIDDSSDVWLFDGSDGDG